MPLTGSAPPAAPLPHAPSPPACSRSSEPAGTHARSRVVPSAAARPPPVRCGRSMPALSIPQSWYACLITLPYLGITGSRYYNSCGNRHCPKCQAAAAKEWLADRQAELLPVPYFHVVFTLPGPIADIAYQNQAVVYDLLLKTAAETLITIAADPKHLGARIGLTAVLHTWGSTLTHHPHAHII